MPRRPTHRCTSATPSDPEPYALGDCPCHHNNTGTAGGHAFSRARKAPPPPLPPPQKGYAPFKLLRHRTPCPAASLSCRGKAVRCGRWRSVCVGAICMLHMERV